MVSAHALDDGFQVIQCLFFIIKVIESDLNTLSSVTGNNHQRVILPFRPTFCFDFSLPG